MTPKAHQDDGTGLHRRQRIVVLSGELDMAQVPAVNDALRAAVESAATVYVDLTAVTFIDSTIISTLITARQTAAAAGNRLAIVEPSGHVRHVLQVAGVLGFLLADTVT
jgi:anti-sigma B factor antagonist